jgi:hypothetical protein
MWSFTRVLASFVALAAVSVAGTGCASSPDGPAFVTVPHTRYDAAFDAACQATREAGLVPMLVDREAGVIETAPRFAGSVIEPWTWGEMTASDVVEGTLGFERRLARVEFIPVGVAPAAPEGTAPLAGPVLPGSERGVGADMTKVAGDVEIRVTVSVERRFEPGYQGSPYTRALGSYWREAAPKARSRAEADASRSVPRDLSRWTAVARDERLERVLAADIAARLTEPSPPAQANAQPEAQPTSSPAAR